MATVGNEKENLSPLTDININFEDRQELKIVEDKVLDLQIILPTMLETIAGIEDQCRRFSAAPCLEILGEFDEYVREVKMLIERAKTLKQMSKSTAQLVSQESYRGSKY